jgi:hypothetical protein
VIFLLVSQKSIFLYYNQDVTQIILFDVMEYLVYSFIQSEDGFYMRPLVCQFLPNRIKTYK